MTGEALRQFAERLGTTRLSPLRGSEIAAEVAAGLARFKEPVAEIAAEMGIEKR
ncbi:hypothetical protein [Ottowia sp. VDI28]|uniref:hypothetical protein n=1 Tax=Ottowia sp. VDI28 TaxID=3133968 RepID=UPI003C302F68